MAQKVNIILVDDLDGSEATQTVAFGLDGANYEIDLNDDNAQTLRDAVAKFLGAARRTGGRRASGTATRSPSSGSSDKAAVREWAKAAGMEVSERGRIPVEIQEAYDAAQKVAGGSATTPRRGSRKRTASIEEIEATKNA